jgi:hypothetical protein
VGVRNRERRQAKQKARQERARQRDQRVGAGAVFGAPYREENAEAAVERVLREAVHAVHVRDEDTLRRCCQRLAGAPAEHGATDAALRAALHRETVAAWQRGWQPADLARAARRAHSAGHVRIVVDAIAAAMREYAAATVDERWAAQVQELAAVAWWERDDRYLTALGEREGLDRPQVVRRVLEVLHTLTTCPPIQLLCPPPGKARQGSLAGAGRAADARQLDRVRALLAKAESTSFPDEAETYTAKAQELMARYSIDYALLSAGTSTTSTPVGRRIGIDNPYEAPKVLLLDAVSSANRCRSVWSSNLGFVTVLGFPSDVDGVELLFTSLLVQATTAMVQAGTHRDAGGRSTTRSFRQSFLTAYASRIGERLTEATRHATEQATRDMAGKPTGDALLPVLASRQEQVNEVIDEMFPDLVGRQVAVTNRDGWASGRAAADRAHLRTHHPVAAGSGER